MIEFPRILVTQARNGDTQARDLLLARVLPLAEGLIARQGIYGEDLEDLLQDVMVEVLRMLSLLRDADAFGPVVVVVIRRIIGTFFRRKKRQRLVRLAAIARMEEQERIPVWNALEAEETHMRLISVVESLPPQLYLIFVLWVTEHSVNEMATIMRVSPRTAKRRRSKVVTLVTRGIWEDDELPKGVPRMRL